MDTLLINIMDGIAFGAILFLIALGMSLIVGVMGILNMAHGALFMIGGYVGITVFKGTGNFVLALIAGGFSAALVGLIIERGFIRLIYGRILDQILLTFGFVYIIANVIEWIWNPLPKMMSTPALFAGTIDIMGNNFPIYRLVLLAIGLAMGAFLWWFQEKTRIGAIVRAGMDDRQMAGGLGVNLGLVFVGVFILGAFMAGFAGVVGAPILGAYIGQEWQMLFFAFVVVVVGGVGSVQGALLGAILIGLIDTLGKAYFPEFAMFTMYLAMAIILLFKPQGLLAR